MSNTTIKLKVIEANDLNNKLIAGSFVNAFCRISLNGTTQKTHVVNQEREPYWGFEDVYKEVPINSPIGLEVYDTSLFNREKLIGKCVYNLPFGKFGEVTDKWLSLQPRGLIHIEITYMSMTTLYSSPIFPVVPTTVQPSVPVMRPVVPTVVTQPPPVVVTQPPPCSTIEKQTVYSFPTPDSLKSGSSSVYDLPTMPNDSVYKLPEPIQPETIGTEKNTKVTPASTATTTTPANIKKPASTTGGSTTVPINNTNINNDTPIHPVVPDRLIQSTYTLNPPTASVKQPPTYQNIISTSK